MNCKATLGIIIANFIVFAVVAICEFISTRLDFYILLGLNPLFFKGFFWQIITTMFMHGGIFHIAMNMAVL